MRAQSRPDSWQGRLRARSRSAGAGSPIPSILDNLPAAAALVFVVGPLLLILLALIHVSQGAADITFGIVLDALFAPQDTLTHAIVRHVRLPRLVVGLLSGSALALAGVLMQTVTRNPLASPATLGINAGAYLALVASAIFLPGLLSFSPLLVAFGGAVAAALLAYSIAAGSGQATPVRLALAGVAVALSLAAVTGTLQLLYENETAGLFFWGAGSLVQQDWGRALYALPRVAVAAVAALALARQMDVLRLGDDVARSLGQNVQVARLAGTLVGVFLAAVAVSISGPIGFVGLIVPHFVRLLGIQQHRLLLPGAAIWGAVVLVAADIAARLVTSGVNELPAGVITALIGAPFFVWLARRTVSPEAGGGRSSTRSLVARSQRVPYPVVLGGALALLIAALAAGLLLGEVAVRPAELVEVIAGGGAALTRRVVLDFRLPRLLVAVAAGASLALSGVLFQGVVRNPLAAPSVLGVTSGAGLGALVVLIALPTAPVEVVPVAAFAGAVAAFLLVYAAAWRGGLTPTRLALVGIAVSAFCAAFINLLVVQADVRVAVALVWLAGSTYARGWDELLRLVAWPAVLLPLAYTLSRRLDLIGLGDDVARGLGLHLERARLLILGVAVALAAAAVSTVGTVGFVGLITPHAARLLVGSRHRRLIPVAAILGAALVVLADTVGRVVLAPREIPSGLVTALVGAPYFLWLLAQGRRGGGV